ncbi:MAG: gamma-glutamyltransferase, partial [Planctomycetota bacterium]
HGAPPPSSGGIAMAQALNMAEAIELPKQKTAATMHLLAEISRRVFLDRARHLGDPDFVTIPDHLTSKEYARKLVETIDRGAATRSVELAPDIKLREESEETTHFSVVDADGMAVSNTYTLEASWGSRIVVSGAGFLLNNEMGDFNWVRGYTDRLGRIGTEPNLVQPGKRMLSSQCPVIVTRGDDLYLVTGSPGGRTIINTVFNIVLNAIHFEMPVAAAVDANRFHHQWMPDILYLEGLADESVKEMNVTLKAMGHQTQDRTPQGSAHTIWVDSKKGTLVGVADYRRSGRPAGESSRSIVRWDFGGFNGQPLDQLIPTGASAVRWDRPMNGAELDGSDRLVIRSAKRKTPSRSSFKLPNSMESFEATVEFDGIRFDGPSKDEKLVVSFGPDKAEMQNAAVGIAVTRNTLDQIELQMLSNAGSSESASALLSSTKSLTNTIAIRLTVDGRLGTYRVDLRQANDLDFERVGSGKVALGRSIRYVQLHAVNDLSDPGESVRIDSIDVSSVPPQ